MLERYIDCVCKTLKSIKIEEVIEFARIIKDTNGIVYIVANGGSLATASHISEDLIKAAGIRAMAIDSAPLITASANDNGYDHSFTTGLKVLLKEEDLIFGISGSGNSENVFQCCFLGCDMIALLGRDGGKIGKISHLNAKIIVPIQQMGIIEDIHMIICHMIVEGIKNENII